jgi:hypothetical protein
LKISLKSYKFHRLSRRYRNISSHSFLCFRYSRQTINIHNASQSRYYVTIAIVVSHIARRSSIALVAPNLNDSTSHATLGLIDAIASWQIIPHITCTLCIIHFDTKIYSRVDICAPMEECSWRRNFLGGNELFGCLDSQLSDLHM